MPVLPFLTRRIISVWYRPGYFCAIRLPADAVLREKIDYPLTQPVRHPSLTKVKRFCEDLE